LDFRLVKTGMALYHHIGDIVSSPFSPKYAIFFTRLMIRVLSPKERGKQRQRMVKN
jgi:hypothetical protein